MTELLFGLGVPSPRDKVDGLAEAIAIIRGLWSQPGFSFTALNFITPGRPAAEQAERLAREVLPEVTAAA